MQIKAFICLLGFLLLVLLLIGRLAVLLVHRGGEEEQPEPEPSPHVPVVQLFANVWVMEVDEEGILIFRDGTVESYPWGMEEDGETKVAPDYSAREQVADVELTDGMVTSLSARTEKINGKILGADDGGIEVEGYGRLPLAGDYKGYRLFDSLEMCTVNDLYFGYDFTDLCIEDGEICGILMVKEEAMEYIRVLLKTSDYEGIFHDRPVLTCDTGYTVVYGTYDDLRQESHQAGEELKFDYDSEYFVSGRVSIVPDVLTGRTLLKSSSRSQGTPSYRGRVELLRTEDGIVVINEVLLEEYLYSVVPSEMPAKYPSEALKAQAICARTYAYGHMEHAAYPQYGAHVDDSTSFQVYNNILEQESATTAVKETFGQLLFSQDGQLAQTYYYSTSCGMGSDANVWKTDAASGLTYLKARPINRTAMAQAVAAMGTGEPQAAGAQGDDGSQTQTGQTESGGQASQGGQAESGGQAFQDEAGDGLAAESPGERLKDEAAFTEFISGKNPDDFEVQEGWYRWTYQARNFDREYLQERLQQRYAANSKLVLTWKDGAYVSEPIGELGDVTDIYVEKRGDGGVADELVIEAGDQKIKVISEYGIRYVLNDGESKVVRQDGSEVASANLLPSGFFVITTSKMDGIVIGYNLVGGGFGHGAGMSQNGARAMAESGYTAMEILLFFYEDCAIENIYE